MKLRALLSIAATAFVLAACHAAPASDAMLPASPPTADTHHDKQGTAEVAQLFVYGDGFPSSLPGRMLEYPAGASGSDAPLRNYTFRRGPIWAGTGGEFWVGPFAHRWMEKYDATGKVIERLSAA